MHGARCAGREDEVGVLEVGRAGDLVLFDTARPEWQPLYNPVANLVYSASGRSVHTVIVGGRVVVESGRALTLDEEAILAGARKRAPVCSSAPASPPCRFAVAGVVIGRSEPDGRLAVVGEGTEADGEADCEFFERNVHHAPQQ